MISVFALAIVSEYPDGAMFYEETVVCATQSFSVAPRVACPCRIIRMRRILGESPGCLLAFVAAGHDALVAGMNAAQIAYEMP